MLSLLKLLFKPEVFIKQCNLFLHLFKFNFSFYLLIYFILQKLNIILLGIYIQYLDFLLSENFGKFDASLGILELTKLVSLTYKLFRVFIFKKRLSLVHIIIFCNIFFVIWKWDRIWIENKWENYFWQLG